MRVPYSTPNKGTLLELAILPKYDVINCRELLLLHHILNLKEDDSVYDALSLTKMPFDSKRCFQQQEVVSITRGVSDKKK